MYFLVSPSVALHLGLLMVSDFLLNVLDWTKKSPWPLTAEAQVDG